MVLIVLNNTTQRSKYTSCIGIPSKFLSGSPWGKSFIFTRWSHRLSQICSYCHSWEKVYSKGKERTLLSKSDLKREYFQKILSKRLRLFCKHRVGHPSYNLHPTHRATEERNCLLATAPLHRAHDTSYFRDERLCTQHFTSVHLTQSLPDFTSVADHNMAINVAWLEKAHWNPDRNWGFMEKV